MDLNLHKKVYFLSGSSKGIGLGIASCFLQEGASVVITGRDLKTLEEAKSRLANVFGNDNILVLSGDLSNLINIKKCLDAAVSHFGRLDGVIGNIGFGSESTLLPLDSNLLKSSHDLNFKSSYLLMQEAIPYLKLNSGTIVVIGSIAGHEDIQAPIAYSAYKAALIAASKKLARRLGNVGIRVNVISPGNIFFSGGIWDKKIQQDRDEVLKYLKNEVPLNSFGDPEDIGNLCVFLASDKAKFITGSVMAVDGGQTRTFL